MGCVVGKIMLPSPQDVFIPISGSCKCVTLHGKDYFADAIKLRILTWEEHPCGPSIITRVFISGGSRVRENMRARECDNSSRVQGREKTLILLVLQREEP